MRDGADCRVLVEAGDRIAQLILERVCNYIFGDVEEWSLLILMAD